MYKLGFTFKVKESGYIGVINGVTTTGTYHVAFYENGELWCQIDVCEGVIKNNLEDGTYEEVKS